MPFRPSLVRLVAVAVPAALALSSAGCVQTDGHEPGEDIGIYGQPIKGGYPSLNDSAVVGIYDASIGAQCTGSLIAPNVVLTARHCVSSTSESVACGDAKPGGLHKASNFFVTTQPKFTQKGSDYHQVREVIGLPLDPESSDPILQKEDLCGRDVAMLILADNIDPSEAVPLVPRVDSSLIAAEEYYAVGFGATNDSGSGAGTRRRRDGLFVDCVAEECPGLYVKRTEFIGDTGICQGDSGGPALDMQNRVVGITSRGSFGCDDPVYGHVFGWGQWMKDVVLYASQPSIGNYPPPPWANGLSTDPAYGGAVGVECEVPQCTSKICVVDEEYGNYCSHLCDAINVCPAGFECGEKEGFCVRVPEPEQPKDEVDDENDEAQGPGCAVGEDPTKPVPWKTGALLAGVVGMFALRRRRRS